MAQQGGQWQMVNALGMQQTQLSQSGPWMVVGLQSNPGGTGSEMPWLSNQNGAPPPNMSPSPGLLSALASAMPAGMVSVQNTSAPPAPYVLLAPLTGPPGSGKKPKLVQQQAGGKMDMFSNQAPQWCKSWNGPGLRNANPPAVRHLKNSVNSTDGLKLSAVIVTICYQNSYDPLFQQVPQEGIEGTYVATYEVRESVEPVLSALRGQQFPNLDSRLADLGQLIQDMDEVA